MQAIKEQAASLYSVKTVESRVAGLKLDLAEAETELVRARVVNQLPAQKVGI